MIQRMYTLLRVVGALSLYTLCLVLPTSAQDIAVSNTSKYLGNDQWDWTVFIKASPQALKEIAGVEYRLPSTFTNPNRKVRTMGDRNHPFALRGSGWGTFEIPVKITLKNGQVRNLKYSLQFTKPVVQKATLITADNTSKKISSNWWSWTVFIKGPEDVLKQVKCVEYTLHSSFTDPVRQVCERGRGHAFGLTTSGWGTFQIKIRVFLKDGQIKELTHNLKFN